MSVRVSCSLSQTGQDVGKWWANTWADLIFARDLLDEIDDPPAQLGVLDAHERLGEREPIRGRQKVRHVGGRGSFAEALDAVGALRRRGAFEEKRHRHLQDLRDLLQSARANAVGALLVLLHLLEGEPEGVAKLLLAHPKHHATHSNPAANMTVDRVGNLFCYLARLGRCSAVHLLATPLSVRQVEILRSSRDYPMI